MKMVKETCKILGDESVKVTATTVRVPVTGGHSESVNIEFKNDFVENDVREILSNMPGVVVIDNPAANAYPMRWMQQARTRCLWAVYAATTVSPIR